MRKFRVVFLGDSGVGKSSLMYGLQNKEPLLNPEPTIGALFGTLRTPCKDAHNTVSLQIFDTAGQERYRAIIPIYYRSAQCLLAVFDVTDAATLRSAQEWVDTVRETVPNILVVLVGNKIDVRAPGDAKHVSYDVGNAAATLLGALYIETSATRLINMLELLAMIVDNMPEEDEDEESGLITHENFYEAPFDTSMSAAASSSNCQPMGGCS